MLKYIICIIFMITNIYLPDFNMFPFSLITNCTLIIIMFVARYKIRFKLRYFLLIFTISIFAGVTSLINSNIYYLYIVIRNVIFLFTLICIYKNIEFDKSSNIFITVLSINNLIILGILLQIPIITSFAYRFADVLGFDIRIDYRVSGITLGTLKASLISCYAYTYNLYQVKNKLIKISYAIVLIIFMFIQSRSAIILALIITIIYLIKSVLEKSLKIKEIFITLIIIIGLTTLFSNYQAEIKKLLPNSESTIIWQYTGITELNKSDSLRSLELQNNTELAKFLNDGNDIISILFGNGQGNWKGEGSIQSDCGFVVQFIGLGLIGSALLNIIYVLGFAELFKNYYRKCFPILISILFIHLYMNYKSTSFIAFDYFNLFFLFLVVTLSNYKKAKNCL